jgi:hypothetical protein
MESSSPPIRELAHELAMKMVEIDAHIARFRRAVPSDHVLGTMLRDLDDAFTRPIALARHLVLAIGDAPDGHTRRRV